MTEDELSSNAGEETPTLEDQPPAEHPDQADPVETENLEALIGLAGIQMVAQVIHSDNYDLRLMGLLGFNGALLVVAITLEDNLGRWWWLSLFGLGLSSLLCFWSGSYFRRGRTELGEEAEAAESRAAATGGAKGWRNDFGPNPAKVLQRYGLSAPSVFREQLLVDLNATLQKNTDEMAAKENRLTGAVVVVIITVIGSSAGAIGYGVIGGALGDAAQWTAGTVADLGHNLGHRAALGLHHARPAGDYVARHGRRLVEELLGLVGL